MSPFIYEQTPEAKLLCDEIQRNFFSFSYHAASKVGQAAAQTFSILREIRLIDYSVTGTLYISDLISSRVTGRRLVDPENFKTRSEKRIEREIIEIHKKVGPHSIYATFSKRSAELVCEIIPKIATDKLLLFPPKVERYFLYNTWLPYRYLNYKIDQWTNYRRYLLDSKIGKLSEVLYLWAGANINHIALQQRTIKKILNFEHVCLKLLNKIRLKMEQEIPSPLIGQAILSSLSKSLRHKREADEYLAGLELKSETEALIARIEWYEKREILPKGIPSIQTRLTPGNLEEKLDEALFDYIKELSALIVKHIFKDVINQRGFLFHTFFVLEGKEALQNIISLTLKDMIIKQIIDPHLFTLAILFSQGVDVSEYDLEGFGRGQTDTIVNTGRKIIEKFLDPEASIFQTKEIYEKSKLVYQPKGLEAIFQQSEAKDKLCNFIFQLIYNFIKDEPYKHSGYMKECREMLTEIPILGTATTCLHLVVNGIFYSFSYLVRDESEQETYLISHLVRNFTGQKLCRILADNVTELIYQPGWRFVLLDLIESVKEAVVDPISAEEKATPMESNLRSLLFFLFQNLTKELGIPETLFHYYATDEALSQLSDMIPSTEKPTLEVIMESLIPSMREYQLICFVIKTFRQDMLAFEGDEKFWEFYVREVLNQVVENYIRNNNLETPTLTQTTKIRLDLIETLLSLDKIRLRKFLLLNHIIAQGQINTLATGILSENLSVSAD